MKKVCESVKERVRPGIRKRLRILFVGGEYHGGNDGALAWALRRAGHVVVVVDPSRMRLNARHDLVLRAINRLTRRLRVREVGRQIVEEAEKISPHLCVVYKGDLVPAWALLELKRSGIVCVNIYPDVSVFAHGPEIPKCLPVYDQVLTTKSFGPEDMRRRLNVVNSEFLPHGFGPGLHRPIEATAEERARFGSDAAFIGTWSPKKERFLAYLVRAAPDVKVKVWGSFWEGSAARDAVLARATMHRGVMGDLYPLCIGCSTINIALLSERRLGSSKGDQTTSRTFHIPAAAGFLLHERTDEVAGFYEEGKEIACFGDEGELVEKVKYYLAHEDERERIRRAGYVRAVENYSLDGHARVIVDRYEAIRSSRES